MIKQICVGGIQVSKDNFTTCLQSIGQPTPVENMKTFVFNTVAETMDPIYLYNVNYTLPDATYKIKITTEVKDFAGNSSI